jgi:diguanylate cyclase (GGDEF)-like protein/PAS domain S-box-containing protein
VPRKTKPLSKHRVPRKHTTAKPQLAPVRPPAIAQDNTARKQAEEALRNAEARYRVLFEQSPYAILLVDLETGQTIEANDIASKQLGYTPEEFAALRISDYEESETPEETAQRMQKIIREGSDDFETLLRTKSGEIRNAHVWVKTIALGDRGLFYGIFQDITEQVKANQQLNASMQELERLNQQAALLSQMGEMLQACNTMDEGCRVVGRTAHSLFPRTVGALFMYSPSRDDLEALTTWGTANAFQPVLAANECWALRRGRVHRETSSALESLCHACHDKVENDCLCVPMMAQGEAMGVLQLCAESPALTAENATEALDERLAVTLAEQVALALANLNLRETLRHQAIRDPLTSLYNRRYLEETLERELRRAQRKQTTLCVFMLDIDHFKQFNDTFGHEAGDLVLRELGAFLKSQIRADDIACRYGGEEFTLVLPETLPDLALERAEHLREGIRHLEARHRGKLLGTVTLSIGVSVYPADGNTGEILLRAADRALYRAKAEGRDRVVTAHAEST